jgi:hypothetical protein
MGVYVLKDPKLYIAEYDLSGHHNQMSVSVNTDMPEKTCFGTTTHVFMAGGLSTVSLSGTGLMDFSQYSIDDIIDGHLGVADKPVTVGHPTGADGDRARIFKSLQAAYDFGGTVGDACPFSMEVKGRTDAHFGTMMHNSTRTETGNGTARQLGAVSATQKIYALMHVLTVSGTTPTLDVDVYSDDAEDMVGAVERISFAQATDETSEWKELSGAIAHTWWQVRCTIGGTTPSFKFVVTLAIA